MSLLPRRNIAQQQRAADAALEQSHRGTEDVQAQYNVVQRLRVLSARVEAQHRLLQQENHFGPRLFGVSQ